jgi:malonyl CoA-acyl carrier protein transacylase
MVAGHSYGELAALSAAGVLSPRSLVECSHARAAAIRASTGEGDPGAMAATTAPVAEIEKVLAAAGLTGTVVLANRNSPAQTVLSGPTEAVDDAVARLRAGGLGAKRIQVACAFHSPLVAGAGRIFGASLAEVPIGTPELPVWSNRTAGRYPAEPEAIREELAAQIGAPVQFSAQIEAMYAAGARVFVEAGPGTVLTKLVTAILGDRPHRVVPLETGKRKGISGFLHALAHLAVTGTEVRSDWLFRNRDAVDAGQSTRPKRAGWTVDGHLLRTADGAIPAHALKPAERIQETLVPTVQSAGSDALIADFLRTSREMIAAQRDVLLGHLGAAPAPLSYVTAERAVIEHRPEPVRVIQESPAAPVAVASVTPVLETVLAVIAERTGYPVDMIEPELDLEADLSVDSIKRAEIAGELATRLGLTVDAGTDVEALAKARTAGQLAELLGAQVTTAQVTTAPAAAAAEPAAATVVPVLETVLAVIAERTGYPVEMIEPELDLEADLSVDSIKRAEIAGELATRLGLSAADGADVEVLAKARTVAAIAELLTGSSAPQAAPVEAVPAEPEPGTSALVVAPRRLVLTEYDLPESTVDTIAGKRFLVLGSSPAAALLRDGLATHGAEVVLATEVPAGRFDGVIHLPERDPDPVLPDMFPVYQQVLATGPAGCSPPDPPTGCAASTGRCPVNIRKPSPGSSSTPAMPRPNASPPACWPNCPLWTANRWCCGRRTPAGVSG